MARGKHSRRSVKQAVKPVVKQSVKHGNASGAFAKDMLRMWGRNWKRFASIAVITMLGVAVLTGIYAGCRDMFRGADRFLDGQRLYDIQVVSTLGLTDDDVTALKGVDGVKDVHAERTASANVEIDGTEKSVTLSEIGTDGMNQPYLQEGKLPADAGQVAVTKRFIIESGLKIGDTLSVTLDDGDSGSSDSADANADDTAAESTDSSGLTITFPTDLTITGVVLDPLDMQNPEGYSTGAFRSSATADYTFFLPSDGVSGDIYTAVSLEVEGAAELDTFSNQYDNAVRQVRDRIENDVQSKRQKARRQQLVDDAKQKIADARAQADQQFADAQSQIDQQRDQLNQQVDKAITASGGRVSAAAQDGSDEQAAAALETQRNAIIGRSTQLMQAKQQLDDAQSQLDQQKTDAYAELDSQESKIDADIPAARWYVNTRSSAGTFSSLKSDLNSIESIGRAFPIVFLLVAVLMSLTAMTRMVEEDRGLIGTYMGLGYGRATIAMRYVLFALLACLIGGGLGDLLGFLGIPAFLLVVLEGLYVVPGTTLLYDWVYGSAGVLLFVIGVTVATMVACRGEVRQMPAELMRPKSPKAGSRVFLERIGPLWKRMKFLNKVTARNLFRFKGRLFMTVGGVAGCTALIVCGLAINDTVDALPARQYQDIYQYDLMVVTDHDKLADVEQQLQDDSVIGNATRPVLARVESGEMANADDESESVQLIVVPNALDLQDIAYVNGMEHNIGDPNPAAGGVIVSKSAANALGIEGGSNAVTLKNDDMKREKVHVAGVSQSVIGSDVYMTTAYYRLIFGDGVNVSESAGEQDGTPTATQGDSATDSAGGSSTDSANADDTVSNGVDLNAIFTKMDGAKFKGDDDAQIKYADKLAKNKNVLSTVSTADMEQRFNFDLMGAVVALIVALAGALALVVLFTLASTNVSERVREMATLKVLGFFDREVHRYVNREMIILTLMGIVVGLPLGRGIGGLLTQALNMPGIYFAVTVRWSSYAIAAAVTLAFALLVQLFTNPVLDRIDPVSSLKSVE